MDYNAQTPAEALHAANLRHEMLCRYPDVDLAVAWCSDHNGDRWLELKCPQTRRVVALPTASVVSDASRLVPLVADSLRLPSAPLG